MQINAVSNLVSALGHGNSSEKTGSTSSFTDLFSEALADAIDTDAADRQGTLSLLAGEDVGLHTTMIESEKAELALNLAIQIRNKIIDAYNEVMRMQL
ncbi:MAG: flagellar hook-basal body complex protein FliE [Christensenellales bacterium]